MSATRWLVASAVVALAGSLCSACDKDGQADIAITLQRPGGEAVLGRPIRLNVVFQNNLKRDVRIEGFDPETGLYMAGRMVCADGTRGGSVTSKVLTATTNISVERLSGVDPEDDFVLCRGPSEARSFVLKGGASQEHSSDLMETWEGAFVIRSPGRFRVSLTFYVEAETSTG